MADKKLTIQVEGKVAASVQSLNKMLDDFAARGNKVARAFQSISGVGPEGRQTVKTGGLAKALLQEKKLFDDLGKSGERLAKVLNEQVAKSQSSLAKQFEESTKKLEQSVKKHENAQARVERLKRAGAAPHLVGMFEGAAGETGRGVLEAATEQQQARAALEAMTEKGGGGGGLLSRILNNQNVSTIAGMTGMGGIMSAMRFGGPVAIGVAIGAGILKAVQGAAAAPFSVGAEMGGALGAPMGAIRGLDTSYMLGVGGITGGAQFLLPGMNRAGVAAGIGPSNTWAVLKGAFRGLAPGVNMTESVRAAVMEQYSQNLMDLARQDTSKNPDLAQRMPGVIAQREFLVNYFRRFGGSRAPGGGGYELAGDFAFKYGVERQDLLQAQFAMGGAGLGIGARGGGAIEQYARMVSAGIDPGVASSIIGQTAAQGGGVAGFMMGMGDPFVAQTLGTAAAGMMGPGGMTAAGGTGLMRMLAADVGTGAFGMRAAQQNIMGINARSALMRGFDPYQRTFNLATATALMPGASPYAQDLLASSMADPNVLGAVFAGRLPRGLGALGISQGTARAQAQEVGSSLLNRFVDVGGSSRAEGLMRIVRDRFGGDFGAFMRSRKDKAGAVEDLSPLVAMLAPEMFENVGAAAGFLRTAGGMVPPAGARRAGPPTTRDRLAEAPEGLQDFHRAVVRNNASLQELHAVTKDVNGVMRTVKSSLKDFAEQLEDMRTMGPRIIGGQAGPRK